MEMQLEKKALDKLFRRRDRIDIPDFQRGEVWSLEKKQIFMDTLLKGWFTPVIFIRVVDEEHFECIDGQQRLNAIFEFYNNNFSLAKAFSGDCGGLTYEKLPDKIKDIFDDYELYMVEIRNAGEGEVEELFRRLQLGMPLNAGEKLNAIRGDMRNFALNLSNHNFFTNKISLRNYRFSFLSICAQICLLELEGIRDAKFGNLESLFKKYGVFSNDSLKARKILKIVNLLDKIFNSRVVQLCNRASIVSLYLLLSELLNKTSLVGKEQIIKDFYIDFLKKLRNEVDKGSLATDTELITYQSAVNQAADSKESIQRRHNILLKRLAKYDTTFKQFIDENEISNKLSILEEESTIRQLIDIITPLISECNSIASSKSHEEIFKLTNKMLRRVSEIGKVCNSEEDFAKFIDGIYEILYEGSGDLKRIPKELIKDDSVVFDVKHIRSDFRHDLGHGEDKEIKKKKEKISKIYDKYTHKTSIANFKDSDFVKTQKAILEKSINFLNELKKLI